jgi:hypothetical protein
MLVRLLDESVQSVFCHNSARVGFETGNDNDFRGMLIAQRGGQYWTHLSSATAFFLFLSSPLFLKKRAGMAFGHSGILVLELKFNFKQHVQFSSSGYSSDFVFDWS